MSGGSSYSPTPTTSSSDCNIVERVPLNSVQASVLPQLQVGDDLEVAVVGTTLVAMWPGAGGQPAQVAGSLTPRRLADLLECIQQGNDYVAAVLQIRGALVQVEIRRR